MFKSCIRWILPLVVLLLIATALFISPLATHAAGVIQHVADPSTSNAFWHY